MNDNFFIDCIKAAYFLFKFTVIASLVVGIGISKQCNDQVVELCQFAKLCD